MHKISVFLYTILWSPYSHAILLSFIVGLMVIAIPFAKKYGATGIKPPLHSDDFKTRQLPLAAFYIIFGIYLSLIPAWEEFTYWDSDHYFSTLKDGYQWYPPPVWPLAGRFFPLDDQEFTYLSLLYPNAFFYHVFAAIQLIIVIFLSGILIDEKIRIWILSAILTTPAIAQSYFCLIYPERNIVLLLAISIASATAWRKQSNIIGFIAATFCGITLLFYKETAFLLSGSIAICGIYCYFRREKTSSNQNIFILAIVYAISVLCWLGFYLLAIFPEITSAYRPLHLSTYLDSINHLVRQPWFFALLIVLSLRFENLWRKKIPCDPLWEGMTLGAVLYTIAIVALKFDLPYYFSPPAFITWILVGRLLAPWAEKKRIILLFSVFILLQSYQAIKLVKQQKEFVASKADAARFIHELTPENTPIRIYYPAAHSYEACLFSGFIDAKYRLNMITILPENTGEQGQKTCFSGNTLSYNIGLPIETGDLMVSFGVPLENPLKSKLIFASGPIGFWKNKYRTYVYRFFKNP